MKSLIRGNLALLARRLKGAPRAAPTEPAALGELIASGNALEDSGEPGAAAQLYQRAAELAPDSSRAHLNLGNALLALGRIDEAQARYARATELDPKDPAGFLNLGAAHLRRRDFAAAATAYRRAAALAPANPEAWAGLGCALEPADSAAAIAAYERALACDAAHAGAAVNLAACFRQAGALGAARRVLEAALERNPGHALALCGMAEVDRDGGLPEQAVARYREALAIDPENLAARSGLLFALCFLPEASPALVLQEHRAFGARLAPAIAPAAPQAPREPGKRLRIGYVSGDFRQHSVACFIAPVLEHHDRAEVEVHCFHNFAGGDAMTASLSALTDVWHDISGEDDAAAAARIVGAGIDILVDLAGHTNGGRLGLFARKPAPLQFTWLGYLCTTGVEAIDYRICDAHTDPLGGAEAWQVERPARMPETQWCYRPLIDAPPAGELPRRSRGYWTFGSFNSMSKLNGATIAAWSRVLHAVVGSRLRLVCLPDCAAGLRHAFAAHGVDAGRIDLVARASIQEYFAGFREVDIALDTFPYCGGTTTCDALLMGVPVATVAGERAVSRSGVSLLNAVGLPQWIARDAASLADMIQALTAEPERIVALRRELPGRMRASPLMDGKRFAAGVEAIYRAAWREHCGRPPAGAA